MEKICVLGLGEPGTGKTQYGFVVAGFNGTPGRSTDYMNTFSGVLDDFFYKDEEEDKSRLFISGKIITCTFKDFGGQLKKEEYLPHVNEEDTSGIIYFGSFADLKGAASSIKRVDNEITAEFERINQENIKYKEAVKSKLPVVIYLSKLLTKAAKDKGVNSSRLINGDYKAVEDFFELIPNATIIIGDSVGPKMQFKKTGKLSPEYYLVKTPYDVLDIPQRVGNLALISSTIVFPKFKTKSGLNSLEETLRKEFKACGALRSDA